MHLNNTILFKITQKPVICCTSNVLNKTFINITRRFFVCKSNSEQIANVNKNDVNVETNYNEYELSGEQFEALEGGLCNSESPKIISPQGSKILKAAIIGTPNAGKSTLINKIVGRQIFAISKKIHTTRCKAKGVHTDDKTQLVFLDTPGLVSGYESNKHNLERSFISDGEESIQEADVVAIVHDVAGERYNEQLDPKVLRLLHFYPDKHTILIINKIDCLKSRRVLLDIANNLTNKKVPSNKNVREIANKVETDWSPKTEFSIIKVLRKEKGWPHFKEVFMVSALDGDGVKDIKDYLLANAKPGEWLFPKHIFTDQTYIKIIQECIKSKLLDFLPNEIPYNLGTQLEYYDRQVDGTMTVVVLIGCKTPRIERLVMGAGGKRIKSIAKAAEEDLANTFRTYVRLRLVVSRKRQCNTNIENLVESGELDFMNRNEQ